MIRDAMALGLPRRALQEPLPMSVLRPTRRLIHHVEPAAEPTPVSEYRKNRSSGLAFGSLDQTPRTKTVRAKTEPLKKSLEKVREETGPTCKERPKNNRGHGGSRAFVPWCDKKR